MNFSDRIYKVGKISIFFLTRVRSIFEKLYIQNKLTKLTFLKNWHDVDFFQLRSFFPLIFLFLSVIGNDTSPLIFYFKSAIMIVSEWSLGSWKKLINKHLCVKPKKKSSSDYYTNSKKKFKIYFQLHLSMQLLIDIIELMIEFTIKN